MKSTKTVRLGDVCEVVRGVRVTRKDLASDGKYPVYQNSLKPLGMYSAYNCEGNNPFMIMALAAGEVAWSKSPFWAADDCTYFTNLKSLNPRYLYYTLQAKKQELLRYVKQTTIPRLSNKYLESLEIPLPPLSEQEAIVARLDAALVRATRLAEHFATIAQNADLSFKATLAETFARGAEESRGSRNTRNPREPSEPREPSQEWPLVRLGDVCESLSTGPFGSALHRSDYEETGIPIVNPMHITNGEIRATQNMAVSEATAQRLANYRLKKDDVVIGRRGEMGRLAIVGEKEQGWLCGTGCFFLHLTKDIFPQYFLFAMTSQPCISQMTGVATGTTIPNLNSSTLMGISFPLPPLSVQRDIVARLDAARARCEGIAEQARRGAAAVENLKKALLKEAFE